MAIVALFGLAAFSTAAQAINSRPISVYPVPKTPVASDSTGFSFRGVKPGDLGPIKVVGTRSGRHGGSRVPHSDGRGVSWVPKSDFRTGEYVRVQTRRNLVRSGNSRFWVRIGRFYGNDDKPAGPGEPKPRDGLKSRPDLKPVTLDVLESEVESTAGKIFFAPKEDGLSIADRFGRISYFQPIGFGSKGNQVWNFQRRIYRNRQVLTYWKGPSSSQQASPVGRFSQIGHYVILDNNYRRIARFTPGNGYGSNIHEFEITPRDTALVAAYRGVRRDLRPVGGKKNGKILDNVVQEIDLKTGAVLFEWHGIGSVAIKASEAPVPKDGSLWDFLHINAAKTDADSYLLSGRRMSTIYRVDRRTARVKWRLRGDGKKPKTNNFELGDGADFGYQHDMKRLANGDISLFDNSINRPESPLPEIHDQSSALILNLSDTEKGREATLVERYNHEPDPVVSRSQGSAQQLEDGNVFVGWGSVSRMTEFTPEGDIAFDATFDDAEESSYRASRAPWRGLPGGRPAIASKATGSGATVWASWNGATLIRHWKVFTGSDPGELEEIGASSWKGLETEIPVDSVKAKVQVVAYGDEDEELGRSKLVSLDRQSR